MAVSNKANPERLMSLAPPPSERYSAGPVLDSAASRDRLCPALGEMRMKPTRRLSRRSFLARVAGGAIVAGGALTMVGAPAGALQVTDSDRGPNADPAGRGRGVTDSDSGPNADPAGRGRGVTDS